jgi:inhibitor of cysteine peptidase
MRSLFFALLFLVGCSGSSTRPLVIADTGTIRYQNLEGGFWGILGDGGGRYDVVTGLPDALKVDGIRVKFQAQPSAENVSFHMWGQAIDIESIHRLE